MTTFSYFNKGVLNAIPGQPLESDGRFITYLNPLGNPLYAATTTAIGLYPASTATPITYVNNLTGATVTGVITTDASPTADEILAQLYAILPRSVQASTNVAGNVINYVSTVAAAEGAFTLTIGSTVIANSTVPSAATTFKVGRVLVPETANVDLAAPANDSTRRFRYPVVTDTAQTLSQAVISVLSTATNITRVGGRDTQGLIIPGSTAPGMAQGLICVYPITALTGTSTLLVETNVVNDTVGRLTATPTATTLTLPVNKFFIESGAATPNRPVALRL